MRSFDLSNHISLDSPPLMFHFDQQYNQGRIEPPKVYAPLVQHSSHGYQSLHKINVIISLQLGNMHTAYRDGAE